MELQREFAAKQLMLASELRRSLLACEQSFLRGIDQKALGFIGALPH